MSVTDTTLENGRYKVTIDANGDIAGVFDKTLKRELLSAPARLEIKTDNPRNWPAWNMDFEDQMRAPRAYVQGPAKVRIVENGPVRVALEIARETEGSKFVQTIRLSAGDAGNRVEVATALDWMTKEAHLKAVFPLTASNPNATYNWDIGTIERPTNHERQFEVASHQWFDLTDKAGAFGVTVLSDSKIASDKPADNMLRLTLVRTPGIRGGYEDQSSQDLGHHEFVYGLAGHAGDWRLGQTDWQAQRLNAPLMAFEPAKRAGALGKTFALLTVSNGRVRVLAMKKAEQSDEMIVRAVELDGRPAKGVRFTFASPLAGAREVNGAEDAVGDASVVKGELVADFTPYQVRSFALKLGAAPATVARPASQAVKLAYDQPVASTDRSVSGGRFDSGGRSLPAEMLPASLPFAGVTFTLGPANGFNAMVARGQTIQLPAGANHAGLPARGLGQRRPADDVPAGHDAGRADDPGLGRLRRSVGQPDLEVARGTGSAAAGAARTAARHAAADADGHRVRRPDAGLHQAGAGGVVRVAPPRARRLQRPVRILLPVCLRDRHPGGRDDADAPDERADQDSRGDSVGRGGSGAAGGAAAGHDGQVGSELTRSVGTDAVSRD